MRAARRRRPPRRSFSPPPAGVDLAAVADRASYIGSGEHKSFPSFAGPPQLRADASKCDPSLADADELTSWLRDAIRLGQVSALWEGDFPRYVWCKQAGIAYEGRLLNQVLGQYKGYPLEPGEEPGGLK